MTDLPAPFDRPSLARRIAEEVRDVIWTGSPDLSKIHYVNAAFETTSGRSRQDLYLSPGSLFDLVHRDDRERVRAVISESTGDEWTVEFRIVRPDGTVRHVECRGFAVETGSDDEVRRSGICRDITDQVLTEQGLRRTEMLLDQASRLSQVGSWERDLETGEAIWNDELYRIYGLDPAAGPPSEPDMAKLFHPDDRAKIEAVIEAASVDGTPWNVDLRVVTELGGLRWVRTMGRAGVVNGRTVKLWGSVQDVTERVVAAEQLRKTQALFDQTSRLTHIGGWERDAATMVTTWTDELYDIYGVPAGEQLTEENILMLYHPDDRPLIEATVEKAFSDGESWDQRLRVITPAGVSKWVRSTGNAVIVDGRTVRLWGSIQDITRQVEAELRLERLADLLAQTGQLARVGGWERNLKTGEALWSDELYRIFGIPVGADTLSVEALETQYHPEDRSVLAAAVAAAADGTPYDLHARIFTDDGTQKWIHAICKPTVVDGVVTRLWGSVQDVTQHVEAEHRIERSEALLTQTGKLAAVGGWERDMVTKTATWTDGMYEIYGLPVGGATLSLEALLDMHHPDDRQTVVDAAYNAEHNGEPYDLQVRIVTADGVHKTVSALCRPVTENGRVVRLWGATQDVTARVEAEQRLRRSEELLDQTSKMARIGGWELDLVTRDVSYSDGLFRVFGREIGTSLPNWNAILSMYHPDDRFVIETAARAASQHGEPYDLTVRIVLPDGTPRWVRAVCEPVFENGTPVRLQGSIQDITQRIKTNNRLVESEQMLNHSNQAAAIGGWSLDPENLDSWWADELYSIFEIPPGQLPSIEQSIRFYHPDDQPIIAAAVENALDNGAAYDLTLRIVTAGNKRRWVHTIGVPVVENGLTVKLWGSVQDVTHVREMELTEMEHGALLYAASVDTINAVLRTLETRDPYTAGHQSRVTDLSAAIAEELDMTPSEVTGVRFCAMVHDIGKIALPAEILNRSGRLAPVEFELIKTHPKLGYGILEHIAFPWPVAEVVVQHHERLNGSGYPKGLTADEILIEAKIVAVADVVEAITSHRPYRPAKGLDVALSEIARNRGVLFDEGVVNACLALFNERRFEFKQD